MNVIKQTLNHNNTFILQQFGWVEKLILSIDIYPGSLS